MRSWINAVVAGNPVQAWLTALGIAITINLAVLLLKRLLVGRLRAQAARSHTALNDALLAALQRTSQLLVFFVALFAGSRYLELSARSDLIIGGIATIAAFIQIALWLSTAIEWWLARSRAQAVANNASAATSLAALGFIVHAVMWTLIVLLALDNLGINITALVAGLGIGGVAIALAVQNILGDLFASLSIVIDKPFVIGDFIVVDDYMGTVEYVGLKTTRVRSLSGEQIIFSNGDLLKARTRNFKHMVERRVAFSFGLDYRTPPAQLAAVPGLIRAIIEAQDRVRFDRAHFQKFGASSLDFEVVYWMLDDDFNRYMDVQQAVNLALMQAMDTARVDFAVPTQALRLETPISGLTGDAQPADVEPAADAATAAPTQ